MRNQNGFTLIEVLVASAMIAVAIGFSMDASRLVSSGYAYAKHSAMAQRIAASQLEELLASFNSDARLTAGAHHQDYDQNALAVATVNTFGADWTVLEDNPISKIMRIDLTVTWTEDGKAHALHYTTFRSNG